MSNMLGVRLPDELDERLSALCEKTGRSKSYYVRSALEELLADWEAVAEAESRLRDVRTGRMSKNSLATVMRDFGL